MSFLTRKQQIGLKLNSVEGAAESLSAADYSRTLSDVSDNPTAVVDERGQLKDSLSPTAQLVGAPLLELDWTEEIAGGSVATPAPWEISLRACGFGAPTTLKKVTVGTATGDAFVPGDILGNADTLAGSTKIVRFVTSFMYAELLGEQLVYEPVSGAALTATDTLYKFDAAGDDVGSRPVDSVPSDAGRAYRPLSEDGATSPKDATLDWRADGQIHLCPSVRGDCSLVFEHGKTPKIQLKMRGPQALEDDGSLAEGALVADVPTPPVPRMVGKVGFPCRLEGYAGVVTGFTLEMGNTLTDRPTINDNGVLGYGGVPMGYMPTRISDRKPMIKVAPEHVLKSTFDFRGKHDRGEVFPVSFSSGTLFFQIPGPTVVITAPKAQIVDGVKRSDRDGLTVRDLSLLLTGQADDELIIDVVHAA